MLRCFTECITRYAISESALFLGRRPIPHICSLVAVQCKFYRHQTDVVYVKRSTAPCPLCTHHICVCTEDKSQAPLSAARTIVSFATVTACMCVCVSGCTLGNGDMLWHLYIKAPWYFYLLCVCTLSSCLSVLPAGSRSCGPTLVSRP